MKMKNKTDRPRVFMVQNSKITKAKLEEMYISIVNSPQNPEFCCYNGIVYKIGSKPLKKR